MSITHKALQASLEADSRLTSMGVLCQPSTSLDAELWAAWTKAVQQEKPLLFSQSSESNSIQSQQESFPETPEGS